MYRILILLSLLPLMGRCGLADDEQDEKQKYEYLRFADTAFENLCLAQYDLNHDGRISRYESRRVLHLDCSKCGIRSLIDLREFERLRSLDCSRNQLTDLDLRKCTYLQNVDCSSNELNDLNLDGLHSLGELRCGQNRLIGLDLQDNISLRFLDASRNDLQTLDVSHCHHFMEVNVRENPRLEVLYVARGQDVRDVRDPHTQIVVR